ncbi:unnamed protein product, partial [Amoebophrya sp. A120]
KSSCSTCNSSFIRAGASDTTEDDFDSDVDSTTGSSLRSCSGDSYCSSLCSTSGGTSCGSINNSTVLTTSTSLTPRSATPLRVDCRMPGPNPHDRRTIPNVVIAAQSAKARTISIGNPRTEAGQEGTKTSTPEKIAERDPDILWMRERVAALEAKLLQGRAGETSKRSNGEVFNTTARRGGSRLQSETMQVKILYIAFGRQSFNFHYLAMEHLWRSLRNMPENILVYLVAPDGMQWKNEESALLGKLGRKQITSAWVQRQYGKCVRLQHRVFAGKLKWMKTKSRRRTRSSWRNTVARQQAENYCVGIWKDGVHDRELDEIDISPEKSRTRSRKQKTSSASSSAATRPRGFDGSTLFRKIEVTLNAPQLKLFQTFPEQVFYVAHGGVSGLTEAIGLKVPIICVPMLF